QRDGGRGAHHRAADAATDATAAHDELHADPGRAALPAHGPRHADLAAGAPGRRARAPAHGVRDDADARGSEPHGAGAVDERRARGERDARGRHRAVPDVHAGEDAGPGPGDVHRAERRAGARDAGGDPADDAGLGVCHERAAGRVPDRVRALPAVHRDRPGRRVGADEHGDVHASAGHDLVALQAAPVRAGGWVESGGAGPGCELPVGRRDDASRPGDRPCAERAPAGADAGGSDAGRGRPGRAADQRAPGGDAGAGADHHVRGEAVRHWRDVPADALVDAPVGGPVHDGAVPESADGGVLMMPSTDPFSPGTLATAALLSARVGGLLLVAPIFSGRPVPYMLRAALLVVLTVLLLPLGLAGATAGGAAPSVTPATLMAETLVGFAVGLGAAVLVGAAEVAGDLLSIHMGLSGAMLLDPMTQHSVPIPSEFTRFFAVAVFLSLNGHVLMLEALAATVEWAPVGGPVDGAAGAWEMVSLGSRLFVHGLQFAAPVTAAVLVSNVALGILARAVPQMNMLMVAFPVQIGIGLLTLAVALPLI